MTVGTPQSQAIHVANSLLGLAQQIMSIYDQIGLVHEQWTDQGVANTLATFSTVDVTTDGGIGAPDPAPVNGHAIDTSIYTGLSRSVSALEITQIKSTLDDLKGYIDGQDLGPNPGARAILNAATGG
jgi:hypothetical protein